MDDIPQGAKGKWIMKWSAYPQDMVAMLLQSHTDAGYRSGPITKAQAYSLKVRLQKMSSGLREQSDVPQAIADAANDVYWSAMPYFDSEGITDGSYEVTGARRAAFPNAVKVHTPTAGAEALAELLKTSQPA